MSYYLIMWLVIFAVSLPINLYLIERTPRFPLYKIVLLTLAGSFLGLGFIGMFQW